MKEVPKDKKSSLGKLPEDVRNNMGFMKKGGAVKKMKKCRMDGIALRGKTKARQRKNQAEY